MLKGKVALITGASRGIGRAIALAMAAHGADVALIYAGNDKAASEVEQEAASFGIKARCYKCNVADYSATEALVAQITEDFGGIDILVNNAGITRDKLIMQMSEADYDDVLSVNLKGAYNMIKHTSRQFIKKRYGKIINITSVSGIMGNAGQANYSASKAGMIGLTKSVARELAGRGINCNAIAPGFIGTDMTDAMPESAREELIKNIPLKRIGEPEDIANLAVFLASDLANYITGEVIKVDGGLCM
ncbi:MAG TPA: 3-oxoacyl-[acyl-carrier-protein] reductase [Clostridiales bacterium]|jgi:3-oxoacyl-[acyl-carrier protein] reductase|nr:3-oxoacyl-[acyl-carrier-protein] reductase [Clostridiales bacterium]